MYTKSSGNIRLRRGAAAIVIPANRERRIASLLDGLPWEHGQVVIGGYAIAAYGPARYSIDLDIVVLSTTLGVVLKWLEAQGFGIKKLSFGNPDDETGIIRASDGLATVDILSGSVVDRDAKVKIRDNWIAANPRMTRLVMLSCSTRNAIPVARPEAMWALKLQSGRDQDLSDLFAINDYEVNISEITALFRELMTVNLAKKLISVGRKLNDTRLFEDSISRLGRGSPSDKKNKTAWADFVNRAGRIIAGSLR